MTTAGGTINGWLNTPPPRAASWFETRGVAALLTMRV